MITDDLINDLDEFLHGMTYFGFGFTKPEDANGLSRVLTAIGTYYYNYGLYDVDEIKDAIRLRLQAWVKDTTEFNIVYRQLLGLWDGEWQ